MFPLRDENPTDLIPYVTFIIVATNVLVWLLLQGAGMGEGYVSSLCQYGAIPGYITGAVEAGEVVELGPYRCQIGGPRWLSVFSSMFMHGSWGHLIGNMWFLWVFGNNIEDAVGHGRFVVFYLLAGVVASRAARGQKMNRTGSAVPAVGASGAIGGVMGGYMLLYPRVRVITLVFIQVMALPAWLLLGEWFLIQVFYGAGGAGGGVAFWAHVGGFAAGAVTIKLFEREGHGGSGGSGGPAVRVIRRGRP